MKKSYVKYIVFIMIVNFHQPLFATGYEDGSLFQTILSSIFYIGIFIFVIFLTLYGTKFIGKSYKGYSNSRHINLLDTLNIPGGTKIIIVEIKEKIYIISLTPNSTEVIDIINQEEFLDGELTSDLDEEPSKKHNNVNFDIKKIIDKLNFSKDKEE